MEHRSEKRNKRYLIHRSERPRTKHYKDSKELSRQLHSDYSLILSEDNHHCKDLIVVSELTPLLEGIERFEQFEPESRAIALRLLANAYCISEAQIWHVRNLYIVGGAA